MRQMVFVHVAGRMTNGVLTDDTLHAFLLVVALMALAGMGLMGRNDLGLRLPSALEAVLALLVFDKVLCLLLGGEVPLPFMTDPFEASLISWGLPLFGVELGLFGMVLVYDWVEGERIRRELDDHRTAFGRSTWVAGVAVLSLGAATVLAFIMALRRCVNWQQPAVAFTVLVLTPFAVQSLVSWVLSPLESTLTPASVTAVCGAVAMAWVVGVVVLKRSLWLSSSLWASHCLLPAAAILASSTVGLSLAALMVSATAWISGIVTQRKSWRIVGAADLFLAWMVAAAALVGGVGASYVLLMLVASAGLLFAVTTLTQANETVLMDD